MIAIAALTRRLERLEGPGLIDRSEPIVSAVLSTLSDEHISLLEEHSILIESGFSEEDTARMMGNRYGPFQNASATLNERYAAIVEAQKPKRTPKKTGRRTYIRSVALPKQV